MGGSVRKAINRSLGILAMPGLMPISMIKNGGNIKKSVDDSLNFLSNGSEKAPEAQQAPDVTTGLQSAIDEEDAKRRKKKGFAANVLTSEFRFGGSNNNNTGI